MHIKDDEPDSPRRSLDSVATVKASELSRAEYPGGKIAPAHTSGMHAQHGGPAEHQEHAGHGVAMFRDKFWLSLVLTIPSLVWGSNLC